MPSKADGFHLKRKLRRFVHAMLFATTAAGATAGGAFGVVGGRTASIAQAPWNVVVFERVPYSPQLASPQCTGVIIDRLHILTAGHCVMSSKSSVTPKAPVLFLIEAGVSNFRHPLASDHPQRRAVSAVSTMRGYIAESKRTVSNDAVSVAHDLAVLTLAHPLDLNGTDAHAALLPSTHTPKPWHATLVMAGYGDEKPKGNDPNGTLNEIAKPAAGSGAPKGNLYVLSRTGTCYGDSGAGIVEAGLHPTVVGILSGEPANCSPGLDGYAAISTPAALRFIAESRNRND